MDVTAKVKLLKLVGELVSNPEKFKDSIRVMSSTPTNDGKTFLHLVVSSELAQMFGVTSEENKNV